MVEVLIIKMVIQWILEYHQQLWPEITKNAKIKNTSIYIKRRNIYLKEEQLSFIIPKSSKLIGSILDHPKNMPRV
jgi:L-rhamnose mutarotase